MAMISSCARSSLKWLLCSGTDALLPAPPFPGSEARGRTASTRPLPSLLRGLADPLPCLAELHSAAGSRALRSSEVCSGLLLWCVNNIKTGSLKKNSPNQHHGSILSACKVRRWLSCLPLLRYHVRMPWRKGRGG